MPLTLGVVSDSSAFTSDVADGDDVVDGVTSDVNQDADPIVAEQA